MKKLRRFGVAARACGALVGLGVAASAGCGGGGASQGRSAPVAATSGDLSTGSGIHCDTEAECAVCYRANTCGEPVAAGAGADAPECHVSPSAFCMPRRAHCDDHHCVAR